MNQQFREQKSEDRPVHVILPSEKVVFVVCFLGFFFIFQTIYFQELFNNSTYHRPGDKNTKSIYVKLNVVFPRRRLLSYTN